MTEDARLERDLARLDAFEREAWRMDLDLRRQSLTDPALAAIVAEADAEYLRRTGHPWINPLIVEEEA